MSTIDFLVAFCVSFLAVGLKGFQHKNVIGNHYKLTFVTSLLMQCGEVTSVGLIVKNAWTVAIPLGLGASLGMVVSMFLHDRFVKGKKGLFGK